MSFISDAISELWSLVTGTGTSNNFENRSETEQNMAYNNHQYYYVAPSYPYTGESHSTSAAQSLDLTQGDVREMEFFLVQWKDVASSLQHHLPTILQSLHEKEQNIFTMFVRKSASDSHVQRKLMSLWTDVKKWYIMSDACPTGSHSTASRTCCYQIGRAHV